jgi:2,4-dichlorophenol 6-monooxygenase
VGKQIVTRANKSIEEFGPIFDALGLLGTQEAARMRANMEARKAATPEAAEQREALRRAIAAKTYEFNAHGVEMNHRYASSAVVPDGTPEPDWTRDPELYYHATTWPGARLPHVWLQRDGKPVSTLDVVGHGRFTVLTGIGGEAWANAARAASERYGVAVEAHVIGPGRELEDLFGDWTEVREVGEAGCVLVRPDQHVAWRTREVAADAADAEGRLADALGRILGRRGREMAQAAE